MKISVITVVRNSADTIADTLRSVAVQTHHDIEHIVIDGASTDGTLEIVKRQGTRVAKVLSEPDHGIYDAMNKGIVLATGDVIGFLNADDVYADDSVLTQVAQVMGDLSTDACYADLVYVDRKDTGRIVRYWKSRPYEAGLFERGWLPAHPTFYARRRVYERYGGFDTSLRIQSDFELTMRFLRIHHIHSAYIPRIWVRMRMGGVTNRRVADVIRGNLEAWRACRKHALRVSPLFILTKVLSRVPQFFARPPGM